MQRLSRLLQHAVQLRQARLFFLVRHLAGHHGRRRPLARRIFEAEGPIIPCLAHQLQRVLKLLPRLAGESNDQIRRQGDIRAGRPQAPHQLQILRRAIAPVHAPEDLIIAGLHRQMQMVAQLRQAAKGLDQLVGEILGVARHKTDTLQPLDRVDLLQQPGKGYRLLQSTTVAVHILPQQGDFLDPLVHQLPDLRKDLGAVAAALPAPHIGHNAVGAVVVAAIHNRYPGGAALYPGGRHMLHDHAFAVGNIHHRMGALRGPGQQLREAVHPMSAEY